MSSVNSDMYYAFLSPNFDLSTKNCESFSKSTQRSGGLCLRHLHYYIQSPTAMDDDTTLTAPLVVPESTREPIDADVAPQAADEAENDDNRAEDALRAAAMLGLVSIGLMLVILIFFWPLIFAYFLFPKKGIAWAAAVAEIVHFVALVWIPFPYLYIHRKVCYPLRMMLMPLVHKVAKSESIREKGTSWYNKCADLPQTREAKVLLGHFKSSIRRDLRRKLKLFFERGITTQTQHSDYFSLRTDIPIIWSHEKRAVHGTDKSALEEFVKRFLVVFLVSNGYIDRYYDRDGKFCALGEFVASEKTLNNFVYFCLAEHSQSGIWQCKINIFFASDVLDPFAIMNLILHRTFYFCRPSFSRTAASNCGFSRNRVYQLPSTPELCQKIGGSRWCVLQRY